MNYYQFFFKSYKFLNSLQAVDKLFYKNKQLLNTNTIAAELLSTASPNKKIVSLYVCEFLLRALKLRNSYNFFFSKTLTTSSKVVSRLFKLAVAARPKLKKNLNIKNFNIKNRVDLVLRLLAPTTPFYVLKKNMFNFNFFFSTYLVWPGESLDLLVLIFKSNPFFINTKLLDSSIFFSNYKSSFKKTIYYIFKIPLFSTLLVLFFSLASNKSTFTKKIKVISIETAFKSMSWIERESSELFGFFFFGKKNNRKLITDYFLKIYPMLKWVPSVGFSELAVSAEGTFILRSVRVQNLALA